MNQILIKAVLNYFPHRFLRKKILKWNCDYENDDCIKTALSLFRQWKNESKENET